IPAEFLKIYNCRTVGMFTIGDTGLKGEILLSPSKIKIIHELGKSLIQSLEDETVRYFKYSELTDRLICPICFSDTFHVDKKGNYNCAVCNKKIKKYVKFKKLLSQLKDKDYDKETIFSPSGARYHNNYVGNKISQLIQASDEVKFRLNQYFEQDIIPLNDYNTNTIEENNLETETAWTEEGLTTFNKIVPGGFKRFVKKGVEKKAARKGIKVITKDVFLQIKRESGN
ncbi:MAG: hypothetical protein GXP33_01545, partial [Spirochaetes bacterium]|nr:hypothetical protein [Spirochaetota bacterium]